MCPPWDHPHPWGDRISINAPSRTATSDERKAYVKQACNRIGAAAHDGSYVYFTDGSRRIVRGCRRVGAGFVVDRLGKELVRRPFGMGPRAEVYDAEMLGLALAAKAVSSRFPQIAPSRVLFCADNRAAIQEITSLKPHPAQYASIIFRSAIDSILTTYPNVTIELHWVPGHSGIDGNERADKTAEKGGQVRPTPVFNHSITWAKTLGMAETLGFRPHSHHVQSHLASPPALRLNQFHKSYLGSRAVHSRLIQVIMGHAFFGEYCSNTTLTSLT